MPVLTGRGFTKSTKQFIESPSLGHGKAFC